MHEGSGRKAMTALARFGYAARGLVYVVVGWFALAAARGGGSPTDTKGAIAAMLDETYGTVLVALVAIGLVGYAAWRLAESILDVDRRGRDAKGLAVRGGHAASGIVHLSLAVFAASLVMGTGGGSGGGGDDAGARDWTAWLLAKPFGPWLVASVGLAILGGAAAQFAKAWKATFRRELKAGPRAMRWITPLGRAGFAAKGVVFALVGAFVITAAWQADASESGGLAAALRTLQDQPYGPWLLGVVAVGLVAFGLFSIVQAVHRRIDADEAVRQGRRAMA